MFGFKTTCIHSHKLLTRQFAYRQCQQINLFSWFNIHCRVFVNSCSKNVYVDRFFVILSVCFQQTCFLMVFYEFRLVFIISAELVSKSNTVGKFNVFFAILYLYVPNSLCRVHTIMILLKDCNTINILSLHYIAKLIMWDYFRQ